METMKTFEDCLGEVRREILGKTIDFEDVSDSIALALVAQARAKLRLWRWLEARGFGE
jgi:hypothetical protein